MAKKLTEMLTELGFELIDREFKSSVLGSAVAACSAILIEIVQKSFFI